MSHDITRRVALVRSVRAAAAIAIAPGIPLMSQRRRDAVLQLTTMRESLERDPVVVLRQIAAAGHRSVELPSLYVLARRPATSRAMLDEAGLACRGAIVSSPLLYRGWGRHLATAKVLGCDYLACTFTDDERRTLDDLREIARLLDAAAVPAHEHGLVLVVSSPP